jgi:uncharacterized protein (TIGR03663 family)
LYVFVKSTSTGDCCVGDPSEPAPPVTQRGDESKAFCRPEQQRLTMASADASHGSTQDLDRTGATRRLPDRVTVAVLVLVAVALVARLVGLGERPFHWDEARVGYWSLRFLDTGTFTYRPVAGGPLLYVVNRHLFAVLPPSDWSARLFVAASGGLLPAVALLFRGRLRDDETVALALLLAASPLLVYYSRFLRGDVPLVGFGLLAAGAAVRLVDTGRRRYLFLLAAATSLALASSGFVVGHLLCLTVAAVLLANDAALVADSGTRARVEAAREALGRWATPLAGAVLLATAVLVVLFAPRAGAGGGPGLWTPSTWPAVLEAVLVGSVRRFFGVRVATRRFGGGHALVPYVTALVRTAVAVALPTTALALYAFLRDRYRAGSPRPVVAGHAYWGLAGVLVFPAIAEVNAPWVAVHVTAPLAVPAAVGLASVVRWAGRALERDDAATVAAALLLALAVVTPAGVVAGDVYAAPTSESRLAQYAQPADDLDEFATAVSVAAPGGDPDVVYVGNLALRQESRADAPPVPDAWGNRLPLAWYVERAGAGTRSVDEPADLATLPREPPVVVAPGDQAGAVADRIPDYRQTTYRLALWNREVAVFVRDGAVARDSGRPDRT